MPESDSPDARPKPIFGQPETGLADKLPKRKPNQATPIDLGLDIPRVIVRNEDELTIPVNSTQISPNPKNTRENPYISLEDMSVIIHGQRYGYGAGAAEHTQIEPGTPFRFLTPPTKSEEGNWWNWFVGFGEGKTGYIWTIQSKGTLITYEKGKPPLINFIVEDIIS